MPGVTVRPSSNSGGYWVNDKYVYQDSNELWVAESELTAYEKQAFLEYRGKTE